MTGRMIKSAIAGGMFVALATLATAGSAMALQTYGSYAAGCARWESQGAGQRVKCFECLKKRRIGGSWLWVNTCAHPSY